MLADYNVRFYRGRSMAGTFRPGDCLTMVPVPLAELRPGDVVVYRGANHQGQAHELVHRIVGITPEGLVALGDNSPSADPILVTADNLLGRVTHVQRKGKARVVHGGLLGLWQARILHARRSVLRLTARVGRRPYHWLRESGLMPGLWRPSVSTVRLATEDGPLIKYICGGRTVARWWPWQKRFECHKPYDLFIPHPDDAQ